MKKIKYTFVIILNVILFLFLCRRISNNIDYSALELHIIKISIFAIALTVVINRCTTFFYAIRLKLILNSKFNEGWEITNLGFACNSLLPMRIGDGARLYYAKKFYKTTPTKLVVASCIENFFDLLGIITLALLVTTFTANIFLNMHYIHILFGIILILVIFLVAFKLIVTRMVLPFNANSIINKFLIALHEHVQGHHIPKLILFTLFIWIANITVVYFAFYTYLQVLFSVWDAIILLVLLSLAIAIPSAPVGIGLFVATVVTYLMKVLSIDNELALSSEIIFHIAITISQVIVMLIIFIFSKFHTWNPNES